jgi:hypothetical protein
MKEKIILAIIKLDPVEVMVYFWLAVLVVVFLFTK